MSTEPIQSARPDLASGTLGSMTDDARPAPPAPRGGYGELWRGVPRELGFLLLAMPIALVGFTALVTLFSAGAGLLAVVVGLFLVVAALYVARAFGTLETVRLRAAGLSAIPAPEWPRAGTGAGFWRTTLTPLGNGHYWTYLLHGLVINPIVSIASWTLTVVWLSTSVGGVTYWFWSLFLPARDFDQFWLSRVPGYLFSSESAVTNHVIEVIFVFAAGAIFLVTLPFVTRGLTVLHHLIARGLLSRWSNDDLRREVQDLSASRGAAVQAEDQSIRRLERDIHDGPQQRLVRLQMDLAAAERRLDTDPDATRALIGEARLQAQASLEELRSLSRGFAPPILSDRGLVSAIQSFAAVSAIPVTVTSWLEPGLRLPAEIERNTYFVVAELITNASKHSGARSVAVDIAIVGNAGPYTLTVTVSDDGAGGALVVHGHGLQGLRDRLQGLRGVLTLDSPVGGGTRAVASVPLP